MPDYRAIYENDAERYQQLVAAEDYRGELPQALERLVQLDDARVLEVGVGTGRITRLLVDRGARVLGYEQSAAMLAVARRLLGDRFEGHVGDIRSVTVSARGLDLAIAGWVLGHFCEWYAGRWRQEIERVLGEMDRALRPGGTLVILETLGTGATEAHAPSAELAAYYELLENSGFQRVELRTDYRFPSLPAALASIEFFFGPELAERVREQNWSVVPEWTGLWWRRK